MSALSDLLVSANTAGLSARSIARQAQQLGFTLNHDTAARYLRGDHGRPDEQTLIALASVLQLQLGPLREAAGLPSEQTEPYQPPTEASRLSRRQRRAVDEIIRAMLEGTASAESSHSAHSADSAQSAGSAQGGPRSAPLRAQQNRPGDLPAPAPGRRAARRGGSEPPA